MSNITMCCPVVKMDDGLPTSIEKFISLIEDRAMLWDKSVDNYKNKTATQNAWKEILLIIYPDFDTWNEKKRQEYTKKTVKRWTYIRDTFMKSEKKITGQKMSGSGAKIAKPYVYYKQLLFLKKNIQPLVSVDSTQNLGPKNDGMKEETADTGSADVGRRITINEEDIVDVDVRSKKSSDSSFQSNDPQAQPTTSKISKRKRLFNANVSALHAKMIKFMDSNPSQVEPMNRHVSFFNGLIPTLDQFDDDQVIDFQLGVIKLMKDIKTRRTTQQQTS